MIETFTVKNYRCYRDKNELSFVASKKDSNRKSEISPVWFKEINGKRILRLLLCVGLNGTGKTKLFQALNYLRMLAIEKPSKPSDKPVYRPFLFDESSRFQPTELTIIFYVGVIRYQYSIKVSEKRIEEEELKQLDPNILIFRRDSDADKDRVLVKFGPLSDLLQIDQHDLAVNTLSNSSVLATFCSLNIESNILSAVADFFTNHISMVRKSEHNLAEKLCTGDEERDRLMKRLLLRLLQDVGTNITDYVVEDTSFDLNRLFIPGDDSLKQAIVKQYPSGFITQKSLRFIHSTDLGPKSLDSGLESFGTMSIIRLLVVLYDIIVGQKTTTIDEIEQGIHTKALEFILKMYLSLADNCQILVATHDLSLLDVKFLRRDAVRIFEKDGSGATIVRRHEYLHHTLNFLKTYQKEVAPFIDDNLQSDSIFDSYKKDLSLT